MAVIRDCASGIQVVPNLQRIGAHIDHYVRNKTWIAGSWAGDEGIFDTQPYLKEELQSFGDTRTYLRFRKALGDKCWRRFSWTLRGSKENYKMRDRLIEIMKERLKKKPELLETMTPDFNPNRRRLTPGPGYLEALAEEIVDFVQTPIKRFTKTAIETVAGVHRDVDATFCATGSNVDFVPAFTIEAYGVDLNTVWQHDGEVG